MATRRRPIGAGPSPAVYAAVALVVALVAFGLLAPLVSHRLHAGRVFRGTRAGAVALGGLDRASAESTLAERLPGAAGTVTLIDPQDIRTWEVPTSELGLPLGAAELADAAIAVGRTGNALRRLYEPLVVLVRGRDVLAGRSVDPVRARAGLEALAPEVDVAPRDARLVTRDGSVVAEPPRQGRQLDVEATLVRLEAYVRDPIDRLVIATVGTSPRIGDLGSVAESFRRISSSPLRLIVQGTLVDTVPVARLRSWASITTTTTTTGDQLPAVAFDDAAVAEYVSALAPRVETRPADARFAYDINGGKVTLLAPPVIGRLLNVTGSVARIAEGAIREQRVVELEVVEIRPDVQAGALALLDRGVDVYGQAYTRFDGAPAGRVANLVAGAGLLTGRPVAAGATFSLARALGTPAVEGGFALDQVGPAPGSPQWGGGIEQLATTAFRAAVWAGFAVDERHAPPTRVPWLEPPVGLDAGLGPGQDLRFTNDGPEVVFSVVEVDAVRGALGWTIYGPPRDTPRRVEIEGPVAADVRPPVAGVLQRRAPGLAAGEREQVAWAAPGARIVVRRRVWEGGTVVREDAFESLYSPAADVVLVGER